MIRKLSIGAGGLLSCGFAFWAGTLRQETASNTQVEPAQASFGQLQPRSLADERASDHIRRSGKVTEFTLEDLKASTRLNERLSILVGLLDQTSLDHYGELYLDLDSGSPYERKLLLQKWLQEDPVAALNFVRVHDVKGLDQAMAVALQVDRANAEKWAGEAGIMTIAQLDHEDALPREEEIDQWIKEDQEAALVEVEEEELPEEPQAQPLWVQDFPVGESVTETAAQVVKIASTHQERGRYWLANSKDTRARRKAAADIGWESSDLDFDQFADWLASLPQELAEVALAGRLERLAEDNQGDVDLIVDELNRFGEFYNLDESLYLVTLRLLENDAGDRVVIGELIARIDGFFLREDAEQTLVSFYGENFSENQSSVAAVEMQREGSADRRAALEWLSQRQDLEQSFSQSRQQLSKLGY